MTHPSGVTTRPQWYWDPNYVEVAVAGLPDYSPPRKRAANSFSAPVKSAAELRCDDMIRVHNAEVKRNHEVESGLRQQVAKQEHACKRLRAQRDRLLNYNKMLLKMVAAARGQAATASASAPTDLRKDVLDLIRRVHPDKSSKPLDRTKLTQKLNDLLTRV